jgi:hypothetical protein
MKIGKIGVLLLIAFLVRLSISCCDCPPTTSYKYSFDSVDIFNIDNSGQTPVLVTSGTIPKEAYGMQIECSLKQIAFNKFRVFETFNSVYAYDCFCPPEIEYIAQDTITDLRIMSLNDFDETHPANSNISEYFKVLTHKTYITIQNYIDSPEIIYYEVPDKEIITLYLMQPPTITGEHRFLVEIELSGTVTLISSTTVISLE